MVVVLFDVHEIIFRNYGVAKPGASCLKSVNWTTGVHGILTIARFIDHIHLAEVPMQPFPAKETAPPFDDQLSEAGLRATCINHQSFAGVETVTKKGRVSNG